MERYIYSNFRKSKQKLVVVAAYCKYIIYWFYKVFILNWKSASNKFVCCFLINTGFLNALSDDLLNENLRKPINPFITGDSFRYIADHIYDEVSTSFFDVSQVHMRDVIFVNGDYIVDFFKKYHPLIDVNYILVSNNSDFDPTVELLDYLNDNKLIVWFAQNAGYISHTKIIPIPLGLTNRYSGNDRILAFMRAFRKKNNQKKHLLYVNFKQGTCFCERNYAFNLFKDSFFAYIAEEKSFMAYLEDIQASWFVLSPRGTGFDCHRTWESLYLDAIPIVKSSNMDFLYKDLPVLIVDDYKQVTEGFLLESLNKINLINWDKEKIYFKFWERLILQYKKNLN